MTTVLQFSGGKDSLACLQLLKPRWNEIIVCWVNTGKAFPETISLMESVRAKVPHFHEVLSTQTIEQDGYPVDILPVVNSTFGQILEPSHAPRFQSRYVCCGSALWMPMAKAMKELGATVVIRGQKRADATKAPYRSGTIQDGIEYQFPLEDWSDEDVYRYLREEGLELPAHYAGMNTGLDCWNCTAYLRENVGKFSYMREHHPHRHAFVMDRLRELSSALRLESQPMNQILEVRS